jgi:hypothetical protein
MTTDAGFTGDEHAAVGAAEADLRREGERIAQLIEDVGAIAGAPVRQRVEELVKRLMHLYGTGLTRLVSMLTDGPQPLDGTVRARLRADPLLSSLLVLHDIHPDPDAARDFDPGPDLAPPSPGGGPHGLVQIDLGRTRAAKRGDGP